MEKSLYFLYAGGAAHLGWAIFHLFFARIFKWNQALPKLDPINQRVYPILNLCLTFWFAAAAYLSLAYAGELMTTPLGHKLIAIMAAFWMLRFGLQQRFFKVANPLSLFMSALFLITMGLYIYPLMHGAR